jgi:hypothetical protein
MEDNMVLVLEAFSFGMRDISEEHKAEFRTLHNNRLVDVATEK